MTPQGPSPICRHACIYADSVRSVDETWSPLIWAAYVRRLRADLKVNQTVFAKMSGQSQGKISRWEAGIKPPDKAGDIAAFARSLDRNPLEAFVAAGKLEESEAGRGLSPWERSMLALVFEDGRSLQATAFIDGLIEDHDDRRESSYPVLQQDAARKSEPKGKQ